MYYLLRKKSYEVSIRPIFDIAKAMRYAIGQSISVFIYDVKKVKFLSVQPDSGNMKKLHDNVKNHT